MTLPACSTQGNEHAAEGDAHGDQAPPEATAKQKGDPLLVEARHSMVAGSISPPLMSQLLDSEDPAHARARRILDGMEREGTVVPDAPKPKKGQAPSPIPASGDVPKIRPPDPSIEPTEVKTDGSAPPKKKKEAKPAGGGSGDDSQAPRLSVLTRLSLKGSPDRVTLRLNAADRVVMGMAEQPQSGLLRLVVESAGALPGFLQSRPEAHGVKVVDVRRGSDTVQISIQMEPGWRPQGPRSGGDGASLTFVREG
jgi:hypothetical protein